MDKIAYIKKKISQAENYQAKMLERFNKAEETFKKAEIEYREASRAKQNARDLFLDLHIKLHEFQMDAEKGRT
jgi:hypothetical protein